MVISSLEGTQLWYPLSTVLLPEKMWWHRQRCHKTMQLSRCQAAGCARAWHWCWRAVDSTAVWSVTRPGGWSAQPSGRAKRGCRKVKNYQGLRAENWLVEPFPTISQLHHQKGKIPYCFYYQPKGGNLKEQVSNRGLGVTKTQCIRFLLGVIGKFPPSHLDASNEDEGASRLSV